MFLPFELDELSLCPFKWIFGLPCPGCGLTRAFLSLFMGDIKGAFFYHPLFWMVPIIALIFCFRKKNQLAYRLSSSRLFMMSVVGLFIGVYAVRMFMYFPNVAPMDLNRNALIFQGYNLIRSLW